MIKVDIAVPRDVEQSVGDLDGGAYYDIDHLRSVVDGNIVLGSAAIP